MPIKQSTDIKAEDDVKVEEMNDGMDGIEMTGRPAESRPEFSLTTSPYLHVPMRVAIIGSGVSGLAAAKSVFPTLLATTKLLRVWITQVSQIPVSRASAIHERELFRCHNFRKTIPCCWNLESQRINTNIRGSRDKCSTHDDGIQGLSISTKDFTLSNS